MISEALNATRDCAWSPFICILALASLIDINIKSIYPYSKYVKYITIYNQLVQPRECNTNGTIHILWCSTTHRNDETPNHSVPLSPKTIISNNDMKMFNFLSSHTAFPVTEHLLNSEDLSQSVHAVMSTANYDILQPSDSQQLKQSYHPKPSLPPSNIDSKAPRSERVQGPKFLETEVDKYDIGLYINKIDTMSNDEKFMLISNVWHLPPHFVYPTTNDRRFNSDWFKIFAGGLLCYSKYFDGVFCLGNFVAQKVSCNNYMLSH